MAVTAALARPWMTHGSHSGSRTAPEANRPCSAVGGLAQGRIFPPFAFSIAEWPAMATSGPTWLPDRMTGVSISVGWPYTRSTDAQPGPSTTVTDNAGMSAAVDDRAMAGRETISQRSRRLGRGWSHRIGSELRAARVGAGLSQRDVGRRIEMSHSMVGRIEAGVVRHLSLERVLAIAGVVGLELHIGLYPTASPVRDRAHLALLARFRSLLGPGLRLRIEVPMPAPGDLRSVDGLIDGAFDAMVEAETHVDDTQSLVRRIHAKQRDLGGMRVILVLSDTRHHRALLATRPEAFAGFTIVPRLTRAALRAGRDPGGDSILLV